MYALDPPARNSALDPAVADQLINYDQIYGTGGILCYRVEPCVQMLAIQNTCGPTCCREGAEGDAAFALAAANHNYQSNNGPGPWVVAVLSQFDDVSTQHAAIPRARAPACRPLPSPQPHPDLSPPTHALRMHTRLPIPTSLPAPHPPSVTLLARW